MAYASQKQILRPRSTCRRFIEEIIPGKTTKGVERQDEEGEREKQGWHFSLIPPGNSEFVLTQGKRAGLSYCTCHSPDSSSLRCHLREVQVQAVRGQRTQWPGEEQSEKRRETEDVQGALTMSGRDKRLCYNVVNRSHMQAWSHALSLVLITYYLLS